VRVDFVTPKVTVMSVPRDLWVHIPGLEAYGVTEGKLNQSYFYGSPGMGYYDGPGGGPGLMARTLQDNFGLTVDHYGTVNMYTFVRMVDAVGGIDLYLESNVDGRPVDDKTEDMGYFYAGYNHMTGEAALRFSRIRKTDNGFMRMDRHSYDIGDRASMIAHVENPGESEQFRAWVVLALDEFVFTTVIADQLVTVPPHYQAEGPFHTILWTEPGLLNLVCHFVGKGNHGNGSNGVCITSIAPGRDIHRRDTIKNFIGDIFQGGLFIKFFGKPLKRIFSNDPDNPVLIRHDSSPSNRSDQGVT